MIFANFSSFSEENVSGTSEDVSKFGGTFIIFLLHICYLSAEFGFWFWCKLALRVMLLENVKKNAMLFCFSFYLIAMHWFKWKVQELCTLLYLILKLMSLIISELCVMPLKIYKITKQAVRITGNYFQVLFFIFSSPGLRKWELYPRYLTFCLYFLLFVIFNFLTFYSSRELFNQSCWNQTCHSWSFRFRFKIAKKLIPCFCPTGE